MYAYVLVRVTPTPKSAQQLYHMRWDALTMVPCKSSSNAAAFASSRMLVVEALDLIESSDKVPAGGRWEHNVK